MSPSDEIPTLADLRRGTARRPSKRAPSRPPTLFDISSTTPGAHDLDSEIGVSREAKAQQHPGAPGLVSETWVSREAKGQPQPLDQPSEPKVWTVANLVRQVRSLVERSYAHVSVEGEISNWRPAASGHCYFTLKDGDAQLSVVLFRRQASLLRFKPKDGDAVRISGQLSVYESRGQMQLIGESMQQVGLGALLAAVRELKERLRREGLFDRKRPLPAFPRCIGVVTSLQGAALRDIVKVCRRRHAAVRLLIYPAAVQGPNCPAEVAAGVRWFSAHPNLVDVVLVARGGGSWEDLHGFDHELVARAIATSEVPVIVGVGHATDSTIADSAADVFAPTPSAAAELVTAAAFQVEDRVAHLSARLQRAGRYELLRARQALSRIHAQDVLKRIQEQLRRREQRLDELEFRTQNAVKNALQARGDRLSRLELRLRRHSVPLRISTSRRTLEGLRARLKSLQINALHSTRQRVEHADLRLHALSPLRVLERGYALIYAQDGSLLRSAHQISTGDQIRARMVDGNIVATVTSNSKQSI